MSLKTASVLAFERKLDPSDALFQSGNWSDIANAPAWSPIALREKSVRGTISNRLKTVGQNAAKLDAAIENPNPQTVDVATLPANADTLKMSFTLRVLPGTGTPSACNNAEYQKKLQETVVGYVKANGFTALAARYAHNLANARFLWRNRVGAEQVQTTIARLEQGKATQSWTFDSLSISTRNFEAKSHTKELDELATLIAQGLANEAHVLLQITSYVRLGEGQEVFPSQELILDTGRGKKSKTLYHVNKVAAIHSQKLGNALRTIDDWYEGAANLGPIAVEPYGSVTTQGKAYRQPKQKQDFYNLLDNWVLKDQVPPLEQQHFVIATLIRGGVFGDAGN